MELVHSDSLSSTLIDWLVVYRTIPCAWFEHETHAGCVCSKYIECDMNMICRMHTFPFRDGVISLKTTMREGPSSLLHFWV